MRITNNMMIDTVLRDINSGMLRMNKYSSQLSSDRKMVRLSDDPIGFLNSMNARQRIYKLNQYRNNLTMTRKWVTQAETSILDMEEALKKVRESVIDAGGTKTPSDKQNIATLIKQIKEHMFETCNTAMGNQYIFGGFNTTQKPFTMDESGKVLYNGIDLSDVSPQTTNPLVSAEVTNASWTGDIYPLNSYTIASAANRVTFTGANGAVRTVDIPAPQAGVNQIDLSRFGLGVIEYTSADPPTATADDIAAMIAGAGELTSNLYHTVTDIQIENAPEDPASGNVTGLAWEGPITKQGRFSIEAKDDVLTIRDERGTEVYKGQIDPASKVDPADPASPNGIDLSSVGLGTITWTDNGAGTGAEIAAALADAGYVTTALGDETSEHIRFEIGFELTMDATFTGPDVVGLGGDNMFKILDDLIADLDSGAGNEKLTTYLTKIDKIQDRFLTCAVETGSRVQKLDIMDNRYGLDGINAEAVRTDVEDIDQSWTIMKYKFMESIYKQALAAGAQIIQPTLMDFLR